LTLCLRKRKKRPPEKGPQGKEGELYKSREERKVKIKLVESRKSKRPSESALLPFSKESQRPETLETSGGGATEEEENKDRSEKRDHGARVTESRP